MGIRRRGQGVAAKAQPIVLYGVLLLSVIGCGRVFAIDTGKPIASGSPAVSAKIAPVRVAGVATYRSPDCNQRPCLAITFDDGPDPVLTPQVLDVLARHNARATFFIVGSKVSGNEAILQRIQREGHEIGNHTWGHQDLTKLTPEQIQYQVYATQAAVVASGVREPRLFRAPYGAVNEVVRSNVPLTIVQWNIDPEDWHPKKEINQIVDHMSAHAKPGGTVVLHDTQPRTVQALEPLLVRMEQTYQFITVSDLFYLVPGQSGMFYGR